MPLPRPVVAAAAPRGRPSLLRRLLGALTPPVALAAAGGVGGAYALHNPRNSAHLDALDLPGAALGGLAVPALYAAGRRRLGGRGAAAGALAAAAAAVALNYRPSPPPAPPAGGPPG